VHLAADRFRAGEAGIVVALLQDELAADLGGAEAGEQPLRVEGGVGLALAVDQGADVVEQAGETLLNAPASPAGEGVEAANATVKFVHGLANGDAAPTEFTLSAALAAGAEDTHGASHEEAAVEATQAGRCLSQVVLDGVSEFHEDALWDEREGHPMG
jgi:hypothetical protein